MDSGSAPPPAPDYVGAAKITADGNLRNLNAQTAANRPNQYTPWGSSVWTNNKQFDQSGYDAALAKYTGGGTAGHWETTPRYNDNYGEDGGGGQHWVNGTTQTGAEPTRNDFTTDNWSQNVSLSPAEQASFDAQQKIKQQQSGLASDLQGQVADRMRGGFHGPELNDFMSSVGSVNQKFGGFNPSNVRDILQSFHSNGQNVDLNAPQFSDATAREGAQHAYDASTVLLKPQWEQDTKGLDEKLRLQGLMPGTEAYNNAAQNLSRSQGAVQSQLADQAWQTGSGIARDNYASALSGYGARNTALGQQFGQDTSAFGTTNDASTKAFDRALAGYGADQSGQTMSNQAQNQAYEQALGKYGTAYSGAYQDYLQPLNSMNAVLNGQQVQMPNMPSFATAGYTPAADMSGATAQAGSWQQGIWNRDQATAAGNNAAVGSTAASIAAMFFI